MLTVPWLNGSTASVGGLLDDVEAVHVVARHLAGLQVFYKGVEKMIVVGLHV